MLTNKNDAIKLLSIIELDRARVIVEGLGIAAHSGAWTISEDPSVNIRKYCKLIVEHIFPGTAVTLKGSGPNICFNQRQSRYIGVILGSTDIHRSTRTALGGVTSYRDLLSNASSIMGNSIARDVEFSPSGIVGLIFSAALDSIRSNSVGTFRHSEWLQGFITSVLAWRDALNSVMVAIPDIDQTCSNIQEEIRMETRRRQAAALDSIDSIIAGVLGEVPEPVAPVVSAVQEAVGTPTPVAVPAPAIDLANTPIQVSPDIVVLNGIRYETASAEESARAAELVRTILAGGHV